MLSAFSGGEIFSGPLGSPSRSTVECVSKGLEPPEARARCRVGKIATLDDKKGVG